MAPSPSPIARPGRPEPSLEPPLPARRPWWIAALLACAVGLGAFVYLRSHAKAEAGVPSATRDVPRMDDGAIVFSAAFKERASIAFSKVERTAFKPTVRVVGTVAFNPSHVAALGTRLRGTVRRTFKFEGDRVVAGDALGEIESAELGEAQAGITQATATLEASEVHARREKELADRGLSTARESEVAQAELATRRATLQAAQQRVKALGGGAGFGVYVLRSPIAGHVVERTIAPGQSVDGTNIAYKIADLAHLWIELSIFERDLESVRVGDDVEVSPLSDARTKLPGTVAHVGEVIDPVSRSTAVRVAIDHPKIHLRPGQSVEAVITSGTAPRDALLVPHAAVVYFDGKATVFVAEDETRVRAKTVRLGASDGSRHEVLEGIDAGQLVATSGVFALKSELFR